MRTCQDCGDPVSGRRKRCPDCKRADHAKAEKARREAVKDRPGYSPESTEIGRAMLGRDYTIPGSASKPPSFDIHPGQLKPARIQTEITDGRVPHPSERRRTPALDGIPNEVRRDRVRLDAELRRQEMEDVSDVTTWDAVQFGQTDLPSTVDFSRPVTSLHDRPQYRVTNPAAAGTLYGGGPDYGAAAAGNAVRSSRPQQNRGGPRAPHVIIQ